MRLVCTHIIRLCKNFLGTHQLILVAHRQVVVSGVVLAALEPPRKQAEFKMRQVVLGTLVKRLLDQ